MLTGPPPKFHGTRDILFALTRERQFWIVYAEGRVERRA